MRATRLYDLTATNLPLEMYRRETDPLADPHFRRHVAEVSTNEQRESQADRLLKARRAA